MAEFSCESGFESVIVDFAELSWLSAIKNIFSSFQWFQFFKVESYGSIIVKKNIIFSFMDPDSKGFGAIFTGSEVMRGAGY